MKKLNVIREYEVILPTRGSPMWRKLEKTMTDEYWSQYERSGPDAAERAKEFQAVLDSDEAVAIWLSYACDVGNFELGPEPASGREETFGAESIDENAYDPTMYAMHLDSVD